jgi:hypothetical protein
MDTDGLFGLAVSMILLSLFVLLCRLCTPPREPEARQGRPCVRWDGEPRGER